MQTREIPRNQWKEFFDAFSRQHEGWRATLEVEGTDLGDQVQVEGLPVRGISADWKGSEKGAIEITVGNGVADGVTHTVEKPSRVWFLQTESGAHAGLEIESEDGVKTILQFVAPMEPELLDGLANNEVRTRRMP